MGTAVKDWATDYDIFDPGYVANPFGVWDELRQKCPVAHTDRWGGSWLPTRYEDVFAIARDVSLVRLPRQYCPLHHRAGWREPPDLPG